MTTSSQSNASTVATPTVTFASLIALGRYDRVQQEVGERSFGPEDLVVGSGHRLFHFDRHEISSENAVAEMDRQGYRPATLGDLLSFGSENPEEQRKYSIVALGSAADVESGRSFPYLGGDDSERWLVLGPRWQWDGWACDDRFLAVRK